MRKDNSLFIHDLPNTVTNAAAFFGPVTTMMVGEEGDEYTTLTLGEEGDGLS
ncbi:hypothetical protein GCM10023321_51240 [Pseudonocardia eucalypti]|uniref:Uncharacterized protein n=1 Tax=Pseudonocardia eucalypti TaxID=648755 RepID=A0ABP9QL18_9PSEU|nr:hypothetical protein [Pseudonocardia eucalypti]